MAICACRRTNVPYWSAAHNRRYSRPILPAGKTTEIREKKFRGTRAILQSSTVANAMPARRFLASGCSSRVSRMIDIVRAPKQFATREAFFRFSILVEAGTRGCRLRKFDLPVTKPRRFVR
jgi:hypothetical protein